MGVFGFLFGKKREGNISHHLLLRLSPIDYFSIFAQACGHTINSLTNWSIFHYQSPNKTPKKPRHSNDFYLIYVFRILFYSPYRAWHLFFTHHFTSFSSNNPKWIQSVL